MRPWAAFLIGGLAGFVCYACCELRKAWAWDDALDVWGVHGMGGALGSVLLGALADCDVGGQAASGTFFGKQLAVVVGCAAYSYAVTKLLLTLMEMVTRIKANPEEMRAPDAAFHGEDAYQHKPHHDHENGSENDIAKKEEAIDGGNGISIAVTGADHVTRRIPNQLVV